MADREFYDRDRDRNWDREDRERGGERGRQQRWRDRRESFGSSGEWGNNRRQEYANRSSERESGEKTWDRPRDQYSRGDGPERWRSSSYGQERGFTENYQRGGSGSEAGYGSERSHGTPRGLTERGGGTGLRDDEYWSERNRERAGSREYGRNVGSGSSFANIGYGSGWGGGLSGFAGSAGTYMDRGQQSQGRFAGRGPKGWRRSDERIREDVCERLTMHPDVDATDVEVQVRDSEVTLSGVVDDRHAKRMAEEIAESISGVREVNNQIRIRRVTDERNRDQGLGSGFETTTGYRGEAPLGLGQQGQQRSGQQYTGQPGNQQQSQQPQYTGATQNPRR